MYVGGAEDGENEVVAEQRAFYRARAPEYDEWWQRRGPYDRGDELAAQWDRQVSQIELALGVFGARGDVLELAGGTGWWTERLARSADRLTVVDSSSETLELNRQRVDRNDVEYVEADLFSWTPPQSIRRGVLLLLALSRPPNPLLMVLEPGPVLSGTRWTGLPHRQPRRSLSNKPQQ
jgi:hypothetical protein